MKFQELVEVLELAVRGLALEMAQLEVEVQELVQALPQEKVAVLALVKEA